MNTKIFHNQKLNKVFSIDNIVGLFYSDLNEKFDSLGERHNFYELVYIDGGKIQIETDDNLFELESNRLYIHEPNEFHRHKAISDKISSMYVLCFSSNSPILKEIIEKVFLLPEYLQDILSHILKYGSVIFESVVDNKEELYMIKRKEYPAFLEHMLINYLEILLLEIMNINTMAISNISIDSCNATEKGIVKNSEFVLSVKHYLMNHLCESIKIPDICETLNCSKTFLHVSFKKETGYSVMEYLTSLRIEKAKELIRTTNLNMSQIADQLGFCNISYFSNSFKKCTGMNPSEYSKSMNAKHCVRYLYSDRGSKVNA